MPDGSTLIYVYDGSYEGVLCCVFASFERKEIPSGVQNNNHTLLPVLNIETDLTKAARVESGIEKKLGKDALNNVRNLFLSSLADKELAALRYVRTGFTYGKRFYGMLDNDDVLKVNKAIRYLFNETHQFKEFMRFSDYSGALAAVIEPNNMVLPLLKQHFVARYPNESFLIYDKSHGMALVYAEKKSAVLPIDELTLPKPDEKEIKFRKLWKLFYDTIEIKPRHSDIGRMTHMPKRFWHNMTEFAGTQYGGGAFGGIEPPPLEAPFLKVPEQKLLQKNLLLNADCAIIEQEKAEDENKKYMGQKEKQNANYSGRTKNE